MACEGVSADNVEAIFDNVSFIVFNYDRCLEIYIWGSLQRYFRISADLATSILHKLKIIHVYGSVGDVIGNWFGDCRFGSNIDSYFYKIGEYSRQIKTFTEEKDSQKTLDIQQALSNSQVVVFLGFSFVDMNLDMLSLENKCLARIYGTSFGISDHNKLVIVNNIKKNMKISNGNAIFIENCKCRNLLLDFWRPVMQG